MSSIEEGLNCDAEAGQSETMTEEELKASILTAALKHVPSLGWSSDAIAEGVKEHGYPGITHGLFPRGGGDLLHHFVRSCNNELAEKMKKEAAEGERKRTEDFIRDAVETRLRMIIPYRETWPEAMALTAIPSNTQEHFTNLYKLIDDIWHYAGDTSADFNWYTKRLSLTAIYKSSELHLIQDQSHDFQDTWQFLDNRLSDVKAMGSFVREVGNFASPDFIWAAFNVARNIAGVNDRSR